MVPPQVAMISLRTGKVYLFCPFGFTSVELKWTETNWTALGKVQ